MAAKGGEVLEEQGLSTKPDLAREVHAKNIQTVPKDQGKRGRGSGDDKPRLGLKTKKVKGVDDESNDPMSSDLTSDDGSGGNSDDETNMDLVSPFNDDAGTAKIRDGVPTSIPQLAEDIEMADGTSVERPVPQGPKSKPLLRESLVETTTNNTADVVADTATDVANKAVDETTDEMTDSVDSGEPDNSAAQESDTDLEEDDSSKMSDSATIDDSPDTEGWTKGSTVPTQDDMSDAHNDNMRLTAAADAHDLQKHIIAQKALIKKQTKVEALKAPGQPTPKEETKASKKEAKAPKRETLHTKWDAMSEEEQEEKQAAAKQQVRAFLRNPSGYRIPVSTRAMIREVAEFYIPACQVTRELALHVLENKYHNLFCIYHQTLDKAGHVHDRLRQGGFRVMGTPFSQLANEKPIKLHPAEAPVERRPGYMHCGCSEDEALLDFYWWKMAEATSPTNDKTEGWLDHRKMDPRTRTLMFNLFTDWTHMEVDDIYVGYPVDASHDAKMARYDVKIKRLQDAKAEETRAEERRIKEEEARRIKKEQKAAARKKDRGDKRHIAI